MTENELYHYGILGMKWGVRRTPAQLARARGSKSKQNNSSNEEKKTKSSSSSTTKKSISEMSDDELNTAVRRLQLEQQYRKLNPEQVSAGKKFVDTIAKQVVTPTMIEASKNVLRPYIESAMNSMVKKAIKTK